ncbi:hypothetical protein TNCV_3618001 [Trichonephila clavipes]|nr:hypothetical protein TNCV_3618001 [Trichonephila clavipes]
MYIHALQDALFIGYKQSLANARFIAFFQRSCSTHLIQGETVNDNDTINNLIDYEDGQEKSDYLSVDKTYACIQLSHKSEKVVS